MAWASQISPMQLVPGHLTFHSPSCRHMDSKSWNKASKPATGTSSRYCPGQESLHSSAGGFKEACCKSQPFCSETVVELGRGSSRPVPAVRRCRDYARYRFTTMHTAGLTLKEHELGRLPRKIKKQRATETRSHGRVVAAANSAELPSSSGSSVLLWFKHDLRLDDHPGLTASLAADHLTPVFVFDPSVLKSLSTTLVPALVDAVQELREALRGLGSDLVIRWGSSAEIIPALAQGVGATEVVMEAEVEHCWRHAAALVADGLPAGTEGTNSRITVNTWTAPLHRFEEGSPVPEDYREYRRKRGAALPPLEAPTEMPPLGGGVDPGAIPTAEALLSQLASQARVDAYPHEEEFDKFVRVGGAEHALDLLRGYLRFQEPTARSDWQEFYFYVYKAETRPGASFPVLFATAAALGTLSRRRVHREAVEYERARGGGWLSPFGFSTFTAKAAVAAAVAQEYHAELARREALRGTRRGREVRFWRWRGMLVEYSACGTEGPAMLLVHGFGAFWEHYRDNLALLAERGNRVWAVTMPGFGRSEKPLLSYTPRLWSEFVRDFIVEVVGEPVLLAGNSIGGYTVASVAGDWPRLVTQLVLFNSAGRVVPGSASPTPTDAAVRSSGFPQPLAWLLSRLLFLYLQTNAARILQRCYPKVPTRADEWLVSEIIRASHDPGAADVVESAFYLPKPRPLNHLLASFGGPVLVVQGKYDPLNDAVGRASLIKAAYADAAIELVEAGHCPHDELPEHVSELVSRFVRMVWTANTASNEEVATTAGEQPSGILDVLKEEAAVAGMWTRGKSESEGDLEN